MTLTAKCIEFYRSENVVSEIEIITDMVVYSKGTLIIIEVKRSSVDATEQLERQITELKQEWGRNGSENFNEVICTYNLSSPFRGHIFMVSLYRV